MSRKKLIAVDLDDVLAPSAQQYVEYTNHKWGTNLTLEEYNENLTTMWGMDHKQVLDHVEELFGGGFLKRFPKDDAAKPVLDRLKNKYRLVITTSRIRMVYQDTLDWLDEHHPGVFDEIYMAGLYDDGRHDSHIGTKGDLYQSIGADYVIDDQPKHCRSAAAAGIPALLYGVYPWNRKKEKSNLITRVRDWDEVAEYFDV